MTRHLRRALQRLRGLRPSAAREQDLREELESHLEMHTDDNVRAGMSREEARRAAVLHLGGVEATREGVRDERTVPFLADLLRDVSLGLRQLRRRPLFGATAVIVLALGMAASIALFAFVDAALLRPLPYADPTSLVRVYESTDTCPLCNLSYLDFKDWKEQSRSFAAFDLYRGTTVGLDGPGGPEATRVALVTAGFFRTLGVAPALGRDFAPGEDSPGARDVVVLAHRTWQARYGGDPGLVGRAVHIDGKPHTVIGILPPSFAFAPSPAEFFAPFTGTDSCSVRRSCHNAHAVARLRPGVTLQVAREDVRAIASRLEQQYPDSNRGQGAALAPLAESVVGRVRPVLRLLMSGALLLFAIAAFNVTGLLVVRAETRRRELAVRTAMGASGGRVLAQFATEALVLVGLGGTLGLGLAFVFMRLLVRLVPTPLWAALPFFHDLGLAPRVLGFAGAVALTSLVLFTVAPWALVRRRPLEGLAGGRGSSGTVWRRLGSRLVIAELATATVLLVGAGLLGRSLVQLLHVEIGLQADGLAVVEVGAPRAELDPPERAAALVRRMRDEVAAVPGITSVGLTSNAPVGTSINSRWFRVVGRAYPGDGHEETPVRSVSVGYFETLGTRLLSGRAFDERDLPGRPLVAIVNATLARQMFPGESPVGRRITYVSGLKEELEIVGVVEDVREGPLDAALQAAVYQPLAQDRSSFMTVVARVAGPERAALPAMVAALRRASGGFVVREQTTMATRIGNSPAAYFARSTAWLAGVFAALALVLSAVGLHGVVAYSVGQRTREIAIRMALGARRGSVQGMVVREAGLVVLAGISLGALGAVAGSRYLESLLFQVRPWDPAVLGSVMAALALVALVAVAVPARRAASVHPMEALRTD